MAAKKMKKVIVIHAYGRPDTVTEEPDPSMERLQKLVAGYFELIPCFPQYGGKRNIWVYGNEEAKLKDLPLNRKATLAWRACDRNIVDHLRGDIVVIQST